MFEHSGPIPLDSTLVGQGLSVESLDKFTPEVLKNPLKGADLSLAAGDSLTALKVNEGLSVAKGLLAQFAVSSGFTEKLEIAFGNEYDRGVAQAVGLQWAKDNFGDLPQIQVLSSEAMRGANGAFAISTNTIYLSKQFVDHSGLNSVVSLIVEEIGHSVDARINRVDAAGDEGDIFSHVVQNKTLDNAQLAALKVEDDHGLISVGGVEVAVEQASPSDFGINLYSVNYSASGNKFVSSNRTGGTRLWCTDFAFGRALEKRLIENWSGIGGKISSHAGSWDDQVGSGSWGRQAQTNSFVVWDPNTGGADRLYGHVGFVERVNADGSFVISESNLKNDFKFSSRTITRASNEFNTAKFIYFSTPPTPPPTSTFQGVADTTVNIRSGPGTSFAVVGSLGTGNNRIFDAVARGTTVWDTKEARNDNRWFRIQGTNNWISAAYITGNPVFAGTVDTLLNVRTGPGTNFSIVQQINGGSSQAFDGVNVGTTVWDPKEGFNENRWFRLQNTNHWISAAYVTGNPTY